MVAWDKCPNGVEKGFRRASMLPLGWKGQGLFYFTLAGIIKIEVRQKKVLNFKPTYNLSPVVTGRDRKH